MSPDSIVYDADILHCCVAHDKKYHAGGTSDERKIADTQFRYCIEAEGYDAVAKVYYEAVRLMGRAGTGCSYQWGYGHKEKFNYRALTINELLEAEQALEVFDCVENINLLTRDETLSHNVCEKIKELE